MDAAIIYEEEYRIYDQDYSRSFDSVVVRLQDESESEFHARISEHVASLKSLYSFYDYEIVGVI